MYCGKCGNVLPQGHQFCGKCGTAIATVPPAATAEEKPTRKKGGIKELLTGFVCGLLIVAVVTGIWYLCAGGASPDLTPEGFDTPEEAASAYLEGLRDMDVDKMLSTFVSTQWEENSTRGSYTFDHPYLYAVDAYKPLAEIVHRGSYTKNIQYAYLTLAQQPEEQFDFNMSNFPMEFKRNPAIGYIRFFGDEDKVYEFAKFLNDKEWVEQLSTLEIVRFLSREEYSTKSAKEYEESALKWAEIYGMDRLETVAAEVRIGDYDLCFVMDVGCYDGQWYNLGNYFSGGFADKLDNVGIDLFEFLN